MHWCSGGGGGGGGGNWKLPHIFLFWVLSVQESRPACHLYRQNIWSIDQNIERNCSFRLWKCKKVYKLARTSWHWSTDKLLKSSFRLWKCTKFPTPSSTQLNHGLFSIPYKWLRYSTCRQVEISFLGMPQIAVSSRKMKKLPTTPSPRSVATLPRKNCTPKYSWLITPLQYAPDCTILS